MKDIEKDLIDNDPSKEFERDMDTKKNNEDESASFETIAPQKDNPVRKEFETGQLGNDELQEDELTLKLTKVISLSRNYCSRLNPVQF